MSTPPPGGATARPAVLPIHPPSTPKRLDTDQLDRVYRGLLGKLGLSDEHRTQLRERGLDDAAIDRGAYRTLPKSGRSRIVSDLIETFGSSAFGAPGIVEREKDGRQYVTLAGFAGLLVPVRSVDGKVVALKVRRDDDQDPKYLYLSSKKDGGPGPGAPVHVPVSDGATPSEIRITEGELKADVASYISGMMTVSVPGVSNWRPVLDVIEALACESVRLAYDADFRTNDNVARHLVELGYALRDRDIQVSVEVWDGDLGKGIDDLLAAGHKPEVLEDADIWSLFDEIAPTATPLRIRVGRLLESGGAIAFFGDKATLEELAALDESDPAEAMVVRQTIKKHKVTHLDRVLKPFKAKRREKRRASLCEAGPYSARDGTICLVKSTRDGDVVVPLCNFNARITEEVRLDDGVETTTTFRIEGSLPTGRTLDDVSVRAAEFGSMTWVSESWGTRAIICAGVGAKDHLRAGIQMLSGEVPTRTTYTHLGWRETETGPVFLHGGTVGAVSNEVPEKLRDYVLEMPESPEETIACIRASLDLLTLGPDHLVIPVLAAVYRAPLGEADFTIHLTGETGKFKSELAALGQQHYGAAMDARRFPENWSSTANAIEATAFLAKDCVLVIDDFVPSGTSSDIGRLHATAERVFRGLGNAAGRSRMRADRSLEAARPPRCLILSTGEEVPRGHSLRARLVVLEVTDGDIDPAELTRHQEAARAGVLSRAMGSYVAWLTPNIAEIMKSLSSRIAELRDSWDQDFGHSRTPVAAANLLLGWRMFLECAHEQGAISEEEKEALEERGARAIRAAAGAQAELHKENEPTAHFLRLLGSAIATKRVHLAARQGGRPDRPERWGWTDDRAHSSCIGWVENDAVYLDSAAAYAEAQKLAHDKGESIAVSEATLRRRLKERGHLATTDEARRRVTVRITVEGVRREVLHLRAASLVSETVPTVPVDPDCSEGRSSPSQLEQSPANPSHHNAIEESDLCQLGRLGRSEDGGETVGEESVRDGTLAGETAPGPSHLLGDGAGEEF